MSTIKKAQSSKLSLSLSLLPGSDVLSGSLQGLVVSLIIVFGVSDLFKNRWAKRELPSTRYELNSQSVNGNN